jgi:hypothetical protein
MKAQKKLQRKIRFPAEYPRIHLGENGFLPQFTAVWRSGRARYRQKFLTIVARVATLPSTGHGGLPVKPMKRKENMVRETPHARFLGKPPAALYEAPANRKTF